MKFCRATMGLWLVGGVVAVLAGCTMPPDPAEEKLKASLTPRFDVQKVVLMGEPAATDSDNDGQPDRIGVSCYLFPSRTPGMPAIVGKGSFRFEVYDAREPANTRRPVTQVNYNYEQSRQYLTMTRGMPNYNFRLPLGQLPPNVRQIYIRGRFFPEDSQEEAEPGSAIASVPSYVMPPEAAVSRTPTSGPGS